MKYFFVPGHEFELSLAELENFLNVKDISYVKLWTYPSIFLFDIQEDIDTVLKIFNELGGFVRFGFIVDEPYDYLKKNVLPEAKKLDSRVNFSVSILGDEDKARSMKSEKNKLGMDLKRWLKSKSLKCRFVSDFKKSKSSTVLLEKNNVLEEGFELGLIVNPKNNKREWGFTLGVQDFENFAKRDYDRPRSNKEKGMIPPKLARIMINLTRSNGDTKTLWDPFCGSGTILQEAMMMDYDVVGTDVDETSISESKENLEWLSETYMISHNKYNIFQHDIIDPLTKKINFDCIATEPYLGPVQREPLSVSEVEGIVDKLNPLYEALQNRIKEAGSSGRLAIVVPGFKTDQDWLDMEFPLIDDSPLKDISKEISNKALQWDRQHSIIRRNIRIFEY